MTPGLIEETAHGFALLGDRAKLRILLLLIEHGELSAGEVAQATGMSPLTASAHLKTLARGGLVAGRPAGRLHSYHLTDSRVGLVCEWISSAVKEQAHSLTA